jgi:hypothetical protein
MPLIAPLLICGYFRAVADKRRRNIEWHWQYRSQIQYQNENGEVVGRRRRRRAVCVVGERERFPPQNGISRQIYSTSETKDYQLARAAVSHQFSSYVLSDCYRQF